MTSRALRRCNILRAWKRQAHAMRFQLCLAIVLAFMPVFPVPAQAAEATPIVFGAERGSCGRVAFLASSSGVSDCARLAFDGREAAAWQTFLPLVFGARTIGPPITWRTYVDFQEGFAFEYPGAYEEPPMDAWGCKPHVSTATGDLPRVGFGYNSSLVIAPAQGMTLDAYVDRFMEQFSPVQYPARDDDRLRRHQPPGIVVTALLSHHQVIYAFYPRGDTIFEFSTRPSLACTDESRGIVNPDMWWHAVESFRFTR